MRLLTYHAKRLFSRVASVGDDVWWASKQESMVVQKVDAIAFIATGGEPVTIKPGKVTPRWTLTVPHANAQWDETLKCWIVGRGQNPKLARDGVTIIKPEPIKISLRYGRQDG